MDSAEDHLLAGRYAVGALLGQGGCACVYDGFDTRLARPVAIKQLRPEVAADAAMRRRFEQEARTAAQLTHPHAVAVYDTGEDEGHTFLVMERLPGRSLADRIAEGPLSPEEAAAVGAEVLAALQAAHALGLVHRDVKPGNILLTDEGRAKVADFGIAKSVDPVVGDTTVADATGMGLVVGTPAYLAPERLTGQPATAQADLYALGVVLYEALTGTKPEPGPRAVPGAPPALEAVVLRALSPRPADRYGSAAEMGAALDSARPHLGGTSSPTLRHRATAPLAGLVAAGGVATGAVPAATADPTLTDRRGPTVTRWWRRATRRRPVAVGSLLAIAALGVVAVAATAAPSTARLPSAPTAAHSRGAGNGTRGGSATTTSAAHLQTAVLLQAATALDAAGAHRDLALADALRAVGSTPAGTARRAAAQRALDLAGNLLARGAITEQQYATAAAALEAAGAVVSTTTTVPAVQTVGTEDGPLGVPRAPSAHPAPRGPGPDGGPNQGRPRHPGGPGPGGGPGHDGHGHGHGH